MDATDLGLFRIGYNSSYGSPSYLWYVDAPGAGVIDAMSLGEFDEHYNSTVF